MYRLAIASTGIFGSLQPVFRRTTPPVPSGVGPVEMAVLMERLVQKELAPDLELWRLEALKSISYLARLKCSGSKRNRRRRFIQWRSLHLFRMLKHCLSQLWC